MGIKIGNENKIVNSKIVNHEKKTDNQDSKIVRNIVIPLSITIGGGIIVGIILKVIE